MDKAAKIKLVVDAVVLMFLATGKESTVKDIAEKLGWTETQVRSALRSAPGGCPMELSWDQDTRTSYSRNYRGMESGVHKVSVYGPTMGTLRKMINEANKALDALKVKA